MGLPDQVDILAPVLDWLLARQPTTADVVLNQGDTQLGNFIIRDGKVAAALDWEMAASAADGGRGPRIAVVVSRAASTV